MADQHNPALMIKDIIAKFHAMLLIASDEYTFHCVRYHEDLTSQHDIIDHETSRRLMQSELAMKRAKARIEYLRSLIRVADVVQRIQRCPESTMNFPHIRQLIPEATLMLSIAMEADEFVIMNAKKWVGILRAFGVVSHSMELINETM